MPILCSLDSLVIYSLVVEKEVKNKERSQCKWKSLSLSFFFVQREPIDGSFRVGGGDGRTEETKEKGIFLLLFSLVEHSVNENQ